MLVLKGRPLLLLLLSTVVMVTVAQVLVVVAAARNGLHDTVHAAGGHDVIASVAMVMVLVMWLRERLLVL